MIVGPDDGNGCSVFFLVTADVSVGVIVSYFQLKDRTSRGNNRIVLADNRQTGINQDLNMRLDISLRDQAAITRDIATRTSAASSGNSALKISFMADYTLSRLLTMSFYYDRQTNTPLLSSSSYPTTTRDFGLSLKFSLTR